MIRSTIRSLTNILNYNSRSIFRRVTSPESSRKSYIIIPEIPSYSDNINLENILSISAYDSFIEFSRTIHNFENDLSLLFENLNSCTKENLNFENTVLEFEKLIRTVDFKFKILKLTCILKNDSSFSIVFNNLLKKAVISNQEIVSMPSIGYIFGSLSKSNLTDFEKNYLSSILLNLQSYGCGLPNDKVDALHFNFRLLLKSQMDFNKSVHKSMVNAIHCFNENVMSDNTPAWLLSKLRMPGSGNLLKINLSNKQICSEFLKFCKNHRIRNQIWLVQRQFGGKILFDTKSSNYRTIEDIRNYCKIIANLFGEKSYCDLIINSKRRMANSLDEVLNVLQNSKTLLMSNAEYEYKHVVDFAKKNKGLKDSLLLCDYDYAYNCFATEVKKCPWAQMQKDDTVFDIQKLLQRAFFILHKLFDISFYEENFSRYDGIYSILNSNNIIIGKIFFLINKNSDHNFIDITPLTYDKLLPISVITINLLTEELNFMNSLEIIKCIGKIFEGMYNNTNFQVSPLYPGHPPDAANITSKLLLDLFISSKLVFQYLFPELSTKLAEDLSSTYLSKNSIYTNDITMIEMLSRAYFDLELWLSDKDWQDVQSEIYSNFFSAQNEIEFALDKFDEWPCGAMEIFSNQLWCGVNLYSSFWTSHVVKSIMKRFVTNNFYDWNPNNPMDPRLSQLFIMYKKLFVDDNFCSKSVALSQFLIENNQ